VTELPRFLENDKWFLLKCSEHTECVC